LFKIKELKFSFSTLNPDNREWWLLHIKVLFIEEAEKYFLKLRNVSYLRDTIQNKKLGSISW